MSVTPTFVPSRSTPRHRSVRESSTIPFAPRARDDSGFAHVVLLVLIAAIVALFLIGVVGSRSEPIDSTSVDQTVPGVDNAALARATNPSVVDLSAILSAARGSVAGTGLVLSDSGIVLTNNHVIADTTEITGQVGGTGRRYFASVLGYDVHDDLALLQLDGATGLAPARLGDPAEARIGDGIAVIGNALGLGGAPRVRAGTITALGQSVTATDSAGQNGETLSHMIEIAAAVQPGDSGGPLVDSDGHVIGLTTAASADAGSSASGTRGFAIPIDRAMKIVAQIRRGQASSGVHIGDRAILGVVIKTVKSNPSLAQIAGAVVGLVDVSSPAHDAGVRANDVIVSVDGTKIGSLADLEAALAPRRPGDLIELGWTDAGGQFRTASVRLVVGPPL